jgi:hypothetical protein
MKARILVAVLVVGALVSAVLELSCIASERTVPRAAATLFTDAIEPELPVASEVKGTEGADGPALTF